MIYHAKQEPLGVYGIWKGHKPERVSTYADMRVQKRRETIGIIIKRWISGVEKGK